MALRAGYYGLKRKLYEKIKALPAIKTIGDGLTLSDAGVLAAQATGLNFIVKTYQVTPSYYSGAVGDYSALITIPTADITDDVIAILPLGAVGSTDATRAGLLAANTASVKEKNWRLNAGYNTQYDCFFLFIKS